MKLLAGSKGTQVLSGYKKNSTSFSRRSVIEERARKSWGVRHFFDKILFEPLETLLNSVRRVHCSEDKYLLTLDEYLLFICQTPLSSRQNKAFCYPQIKNPESALLLRDRLSTSFFPASNTWGGGRTQISKSECLIVYERVQMSTGVHSSVWYCTDMPFFAMH